MRSAKKKCAIILTITVGALLLSRANGQTLQTVGEFTANAGQVQFLPGAHILKAESNRKEHFVYNKSKFVPDGAPLPATLETWISFDWTSVDYLDQIDRKNFDPDIRLFLPERVRVKKVIILPLSVNQGRLILVCYTQKSKAKATFLNATNILVTALLDEQSDATKPGQYRRLWTKKLQTNSDYGDFLLEKVPGVGMFILLYSAEVAASSTDATLSVYRITEK